MVLGVILCIVELELLIRYLGLVIVVEYGCCVWFVV